MVAPFSSRLMRPDVAGAWTFVLVPKKTAAAAGFRARQRVRGTIDGVPFRSSLIPRGGGEVFVVVNSDHRSQIGKEAGDSVRLSLKLDTEPVGVKVHPALRRALASDATAKTNFGRFTPSQKAAYVRWVADAKQQATRDRRVALAIEKLRRGEKFN